MMKIGVIREQDGETRVSATPATVKAIVELGYKVIVESQAGNTFDLP